MAAACKFTGMQFRCSFTNNTSEYETTVRDAHY